MEKELPHPAVVPSRYHVYKHCLIWNGSSAEEPELDRRDVARLFNGSNALMIRNIFVWDSPSPTNYWEVICDRFHPIAELPSKTRNQVRRALRDCDIRRISNTELVNAGGYDVYRKAFERYREIASAPLDKPTWEKHTLNDSKSEYWGVFLKEDGRLIAWAMNTVSDNNVNYNTLKAIPEFMNRHYPYFGLLFTMNQHYLQERGLAYVTDGFRSVSNHSDIQPFLIKNFLFRKAYCRVRIHYRPWLRAAINILYPLRKLIPVMQVRNILNFEEISRCNSKGTDEVV